jgi:hypothetical protein
MRSACRGWRSVQSRQARARWSRGCRRGSVDDFDFVGRKRVKLVYELVDLRVGRTDLALNRGLVVSAPIRPNRQQKRSGS